LFAAAPALEHASETPRMALAPMLLLFFVPSMPIIFPSTALWSAGSIPSTAGPRTSFTFDTARSTPFPR
jgi:hypothetical protein